MNSVRNSAHIRTHRMVRSFHSCIHSTGVSQILPDFGRICQEEFRRLNRELLFSLKIDRRKIRPGVSCGCQ